MYAMTIPIVKSVSSTYGYAILHVDFYRFERDSQDFCLIHFKVDVRYHLLTCSCASACAPRPNWDRVLCRVVYCSPPTPPPCLLQDDSRCHTMKEASTTSSSKGRTSLRSDRRPAWYRLLSSFIHFSTRTTCLLRLSVFQDQGLPCA